MARFREGDVIGWDFDIPENSSKNENENKMIAETLKVENWWVVRCPTVTAMVKKAEFEKMFTFLSRIKERSLKIPLLQSIHLFSHLSKITIHKVFDMIKIKQFSAGELITAQSK